MFVVNEDNSIYATRGDIVFFSVCAEDKETKVKYTFKAGDVVRIKVYGKKDAESVYLQKDFHIAHNTSEVEIFLTEEDTKFGDVISKPRDYWYEVELNPDEAPQTIIGYNDEDGAVIFKLFPEGADIENYEPDPDDFPVVDEALDMSSPRPVSNRAIARAFANLEAGYEAVHSAVAEKFVTPEMFGAVGDGVADDTDAINAALNSGYKNIYLSGGEYLIDPASFIKSEETSEKIGLKIPSGVTIHGCNSTIKLKEASLETGYTMLATSNYKTLNYNEDIESVENIVIKNLNIDGNADNLSNTHSATGIAIYKGLNITIENVNMKNLCGTDGGGYGVIFAYSNNCRFANSTIDRSSRSNIYCWESINVKCENLILNGSAYRDCATCGSNSTVAFQASHIHFNNCHMEHKYPTGTHVLRFAGSVTAVVENSRIIGNANVDGISIPRGDDHRLYATVRNCRITDCTIGVNATGHNDYTTLTIEDCYVECARSLLVEDTENLIIKNCDFRSTDSSTNIELDIERGSVTDTTFSNNVNLLIRVNEYAHFCRNILVNMSAEYAVIINENGYVMFTENIGGAETYKARIYSRGKAVNNRMVINSSTIDT